MRLEDDKTSIELFPLCFLFLNLCVKAFYFGFNVIDKAEFFVVINIAKV